MPANGDQRRRYSTKERAEWNREVLFNLVYKSGNNGITHRELVVGSLPDLMLDPEVEAKNQDDKMRSVSVTVRRLMTFHAEEAGFVRVGDKWYAKTVVPKAPTQYEVEAEPQRQQQLIVGNAVRVDLLRRKSFPDVEGIEVHLRNGEVKSFLGLNNLLLSIVPTRQAERAENKTLIYEVLYIKLTFKNGKSTKISVEEGETVVVEELQ